MQKKLTRAGNWVIPGCEVPQTLVVKLFLFLSWYCGVLHFRFIFCFEVNCAELVEDADLFCPDGFLAVSSAFYEILLFCFLFLRPDHHGQSPNP